MLGLKTGIGLSVTLCCDWGCNGGTQPGCKMVPAGSGLPLGPGDEGSTLDVDDEVSVSDEDASPDERQEMLLRAISFQRSSMFRSSSVNCGLDGWFTVNSKLNKYVDVRKN